MTQRIYLQGIDCRCCRDCGTGADPQQDQIHLKTPTIKTNALPRIPSIAASHSSVLRNFANTYIPECSESSSRPFFDLARQFVWIMHLRSL